MRIFLCLLLLLSGTACTQTQSDRPVVMVKTEDAEMNAAIEQAQKTLPVFWKAFENPAADESEFFVKLAITDGKETEHFWIGKIKREAGKLVGVIENDPEVVTNVKYQQKVVVDEARISDWKFEKGGTTKGGYTIAVLLKRISKNEADEIKKQLGWN